MSGWLVRPAHGSVRNAVGPATQFRLSRHIDTLRSDSTVCSNCYRRKYRRFRPDRRINGVVPTEYEEVEVAGETIEVPVSWKTASSDISNDNVPSEILTRVRTDTVRADGETAEGTKTVCRCGVFSQHDIDGPNGDHIAERFVRAIHRVEEAGNRVGWEAAKSRFKEVYNDPDDDRSERSLFESAIDAGVTSACEPAAKV